MKRSVFVFFFFFTVGHLPAQANPPVKQGDVLSLERCLEIGLQNQPGIVAARSAADAAASRVRQAQSAYYPQIDWTSSASRSKASLASSTRPGTSDFYSTAVALSQKIVDFGRTAAQVSIDRYDREAAQSDLDSTAQSLAFAIKQAYFGVLLARRNLDVADQALKQFQLHLDQARGFYDVGLKPKFDVTQAQVNLNGARLNRIKAENACQRALAVLNAAMGVVDAPAYDIEDDLASGNTA